MRLPEHIFLLAYLTLVLLSIPCVPCETTSTGSIFLIYTKFGIYLPFSILIKMKKMVVKLPIENEKAKRKALTMVAGVQGVESVAVDMKDNKITVIGDADPVNLTAKLRKLGRTELLSVGPAKEEKKEENKPKAEAKKEEKPQVVHVSYEYPPLPPYYNVVGEESPNVCIIL